MSRPTPPALTIRHDGSQRSFAPGYEVVVGRDLHADLRIPDPRISRAHLILRFDQGRWLAIDNGSLNGTYVNGYRMPVVDIHDGQSINVGNPAGPRLTFEVGRQRGPAGRPPSTFNNGARHESGPPTLAWSVSPPRPAPPPPNGRPVPPTPRRPAPPPMPPEEVTTVNAGPPPAELTVIDAKSADVSGLATRMVRILSPRSGAISGPRSRPAPSRSAARTTTTSSCPTYWPAASTRPCGPHRWAPRSKIAASTALSSTAPG